jgi:GT2 family glycosyltransferase
MVASKVSIIIVTYNALDYIKICLGSLFANTSALHEIIIVDNRSDKETREYLSEFKDRQNVKLIFNGENLLWSPANNVGIKNAGADSEFYLLLNSDTKILSEDWLEKLQEPFRDPSIGISGIQYNFNHYGPTYGAIDGCCFMIRKSLVKKIGLLDESFPWNGAGYVFTVKAWKLGYYYYHVKDKEILIHYGKRSRISSNINLVNTRVNVKEVISLAGLKPSLSLYRYFLDRLGIFDINHHIRKHYIKR